MKVCYFGMYDPAYARNRILIKGLRQNGVEVILCFDQSPSFIKYWRLFVKHARLKNRYDVMIVGFPAQAVMPLAWLISSRPIVMDAFISLYEMNISDRALYSPRGLYAFYYWFLDWFSCWLARIVLVDTNAHGDYFAQTFGVSRRKLRRVFAGAEIENDALSRDSGEGKDFLVHWHGSYIPLHGVASILSAASLMRDTTVQWEIIGREHAPCDAERVVFFGHMPFSKLMGHVKKSTLCLGIFGATQKAKRVIPNKIYEYLSRGKAVITADTPAIRELFTDNELYLIPPADPVALARAIMVLQRDASLRYTFARNGHKKFLTRAVPAVLGLELRAILISTLV